MSELERIKELEREVVRWRSVAEMYKAELDQKDQTSSSSSQITAPTVFLRSVFEDIYEDLKKHFPDEEEESDNSNEEVIIMVKQSLKTVAQSIFSSFPILYLHSPPPEDGEETKSRERMVSTPSSAVPNSSSILSSVSVPILPSSHLTVSLSIPSCSVVHLGLFRSKEVTMYEIRGVIHTSPLGHNINNGGGGEDKEEEGLVQFGENRRYSEFDDLRQQLKRGNHKRFQSSQQFNNL